MMVVYGELERNGKEPVWPVSRYSSAFAWRELGWP
jgi:hypothetical protein